jgi:hypothetical protein
MRITHAATAALSLTIALAATAPAHASSKSCGTVGGIVNETYKVKVTPASISCSTAKGVLNSFRRAQEKIFQEGKRVPSKGVMVKTYRCRAPKAVVAGGYVTQKWICTKGGRSIVGTSVSLYTD